MKQAREKNNQELTGRVISDKMTGTVKVAVNSLFRHPLYKRQVNKTKKYLADCQKVAAKTDDLVVIVVTRPLSKQKHWQVIKNISQEKK
ncbi:MAG: small subunit ribosomal protein S17 [Candidatus Berkelbacteria bacterium Licking1014_2]|uniref:Small subunit ribosomal protein S17 n=1 Tax=Candidatus Berkelbacteria bacterium Licking1014_2 TaxID=2017146 RepID=A0A554LWW8_9BACT|nr:MAG: small subunit ribosomal protein S17 [Candidatus Berkelbacteria bacterium Licking1014_2]